MAAIRIFLILGAAVGAAMSLTPTPGHSAGAPLNLAPLAYTSETPRHSVRVKKPRHTVQRRGSPRALARSQSEKNVILVPEGVSLTSLLPWWRPTELQAIHYRERAEESPTLSAADAWFAELGIDKTVPVETDYAVASPDEVNELDLAAKGMPIADDDEVNAIDLAADAPPQEEDKSWLSILLASLGGALAVASTARFLFV